MIVGESAGIAAVHAIDENVPVQGINMEHFQNRLLELNQRLRWVEEGLEK